MKIRKQYTLFINGLTATAFWGGSGFNNRISRATLGTIYDCTLSELKSNIKQLTSTGFLVLRGRES